MEEKRYLTGEIRNKDGRFLPGVSGNPAGRPEGSVSIVSAIKRKLEEIPSGDKKTYLDIFVERVFEKSLVDGDVSMMKDVIDRVDGKAPQKVEMDMKGEMKYTMLETGIKNLLHESSTDQIAEAGRDALQDGGGQAVAVDGESTQNLSDDHDEIEASGVAISSHSIREVLDGSLGSADTSE